MRRNAFSPALHYRPSTLNLGQGVGAIRAAVYLLHRKDRRRFKVGWALDPLTRAQGLPEFRHAQLDLRCSLARWLPTRQRAQQIERAMHKSLAPYQAQTGHRDDGHSEWFAPAALPSAIHLLQRMPGDPSMSPGDAKLQPLLPELGEAADVVEADWERSPQDAWYEVEDLWLRLAAELPVHVEDQAGSSRLRFDSFRHARDGAMAELRQRALDLDSFSWWLGDERGAFVRLISYEGDALVFTVTAPHAVARWPDGQDVGWQVKGLVARLRVMARGNCGRDAP